MLKEEVKSYRDKHRQGERTIAAQQQQINKMKDEVEALRGKLKDCQRSPEQVASEAAMKEQLTAREGSVKELESRIEVLSHKLKVDARQHKDALKAKDKEIMEAKKKTEEVAAELAEKDLELRQKVLDAKAAAKKLDKCRNLLTESRREATNLHVSLPPSWPLPTIPYILLHAPLQPAARHAICQPTSNRPPLYRVTTIAIATGAVIGTSASRED